MRNNRKHTLTRFRNEADFFSETSVHLVSNHFVFSSTIMSRQDKATTERNAKILKDLVKQLDNKVCADCKRNG